jgi:hypothetical protein
MNEFVKRGLIRTSDDGTFGLLSISFHLNQVILHDLEENQFPIVSSICSSKEAT